MSRKKRFEWEEFIDKYNKPLLGQEKYARLKVDNDTMMNFIESEGEMATKELTTKVVRELLKLISLPDEVYNAVKEKQDRIIREREMNSFRKTYEKSEQETSLKKVGYVYFLKEYHGNAVKIGCAKDPRKRIGEMMFVPSIPVEIIHTIKSKNAHCLETLFHRYFYKQRIKEGLSTEFFELTEEDMQHILKRNLPEEMLNLIIEEEYELPPRLRRLERKKQLEQMKKV
ncbi:GIY-YIG nuclease family protein [Neobacillus soli]|uniref:GIY-YIG nuclease family protein n=1 Tax=Neobacillus soli TaxID=220688 RepID=UPI000826C979|nr:GIY-YIG nuclease family protein [Neobacillus soli]